MKKISSVLSVYLILFPGFLFGASEESLTLNIHLSGTIMATRSCYLDPETTDIKLDFGPVFTRELLSHTRTAGTPFSVNLLNCDTGLGNEALFTFSGNGSLTSPGFIAPDNNTPDRGIVIGLETPGGTPLPANTPIAGRHLTDGDNHMTLNAFVKATPDAIASQKILPGEFSASSVFTVEYQ